MRGPRGRAVGLPQLGFVRPVIGGEDHGVAEHAERVRDVLKEPVAIGLGAEAGDDFRAGRGAVARPERAGTGGGGGREVEGVVNDGQVSGERAGRPGIEVEEQPGAGDGAVASPELDSVGGVVVGEVQRAVNRRQLAARVGVRAGIPRVDVGELGRAGRRAVADPELGRRAGPRRLGGEEELVSGDRRSQDRRADRPGPPAAALGGVPRAFTSVVPAGVPSLTQRLGPCTASSAPKKSLDPTAVRPESGSYGEARIDEVFQQRGAPGGPVGRVEVFALLGCVGEREVEHSSRRRSNRRRTRCSLRSSWVGRRYRRPWSWPRSTSSTGHRSRNRGRRCSSTRPSGKLPDLAEPAGIATGTVPAAVPLLLNSRRFVRLPSVTREVK